MVSLTSEQALESTDTREGDKRPLHWRTHRAGPVNKCPKFSLPAFAKSPEFEVVN